MRFLKIRVSDNFLELRNDTHHPSSASHPRPDGAASELRLTLVILQSDAAVSVRPTSDQLPRCWTLPMTHHLIEDTQ